MTAQPIAMPDDPAVLQDAIVRFAEILNCPHEQFMSPVLRFSVMQADALQFVMARVDPVPSRDLFGYLQKRYPGRANATFGTSMNRLAVRLELFEIRLDCDDYEAGLHFSVGGTSRQKLMDMTKGWIAGMDAYRQVIEKLGLPLMPNADDLPNDVRTLQAIATELLVLMRGRSERLELPAWQRNAAADAYVPDMQNLIGAFITAGNGFVSRARLATAMHPFDPEALPRFSDHRTHRLQALRKRTEHNRIRIETGNSDGFYIDARSQRNLRQLVCGA